MPADFRIVSLCGSAGALSAYIEILHDVPQSMGMAFVVLTHRRVKAPCWLVDILSTVTTMHVEEIVDGTVLRPNCVYVIPAGKDLTMDGKAFQLVPASTVSGWPDAFNIYLDSVARSTCDRALTVILSGLAQDGSAALNGLRTSGGINYAQQDAPFPSMPRSAMATGMIDYVGSPASIAAAIAALPRLGVSVHG